MNVDEAFLLYSVQTYTYAGGNRVNFIDRTGMAPEKPWPTKPMWGEGEMPIVVLAEEFGPLGLAAGLAAEAIEGAEAAAEAPGVLPRMGYIEPEGIGSQVRFSQKGCSYFFRNKKTGEITGTIDDLADQLRSDPGFAESLEPVRVVEDNSKYYSIDNRRLEAARRAGVPIRYRMATSQKEMRIFREHFDTPNDGVSIRVRGEP